MTNGFAIQSDNYFKSQTYFYGSINENEGEIFEDQRTYEQGFLLGLGGQFKNIILDLRYQQGNGMSKVDSIKTTSKRYSVLLGFRF